MSRTVVAGSLALAAVFGCASHEPSPELVDARAAYLRAQQGLPSQLDKGGLYDAKRALDSAEQAHTDDPGSDRAKNLAYVAERKALLSEANARTALARGEEAEALAAAARIEREQLATARGELRDARARLGDEAARLQEERKARAAAEQRTKDAIQSLAAIAAIKDGPRGATIISLPGGLLFETGKAELMPTARERLSQVANALGQTDRPVNVIGYTDNVGDDAKNRELSKRRADVVKDYLVSRGVREERLHAEGRGKDDPLASNASPEGRAMNRRVDIVVEAEKPKQ
jgi:outer membrane protein OmpA-like peptidoglycan-associated protein